MYPFRKSKRAESQPQHSNSNVSSSPVSILKKIRDRKKKPKEKDVTRGVSFADSPSEYGTDSSSSSTSGSSSEPSPLRRTASVSYNLARNARLETELTNMFCCDRISKIAKHEKTKKSFYSEWIARNSNSLIIKENDAHYYPIIEAIFKYFADTHSESFFQITTDLSNLKVAQSSLASSDQRMYLYLARQFCLYFPTYSKDKKSDPITSIATAQSELALLKKQLIEAETDEETISSNEECAVEQFVNQDTPSQVLSTELEKLFEKTQSYCTLLLPFGYYIHKKIVQELNKLKTEEQTELFALTKSTMEIHLGQTLTTILIAYLPLESNIAEIDSRFKSLSGLLFDEFSLEYMLEMHSCITYAYSLTIELIQKSGRINGAKIKMNEKSRIEQNPDIEKDLEINAKMCSEYNLQINLDKNGDFADVTIFNCETHHSPSSLELNVPRGSSSDTTLVVRGIATNSF